MALGVYLFMCGVLFGQTISVSDDSPAGSPVSITGTLTFPDPSRVECSITGHNQWSKSIILAVAELKLVKPSGEPAQIRFERDTFFKPQPISLPESDFLIGSDCEAGGTERVKINGEWVDTPRTPTMPGGHASVIYLEFEDGSEWGDYLAAARTIERRPAVLASLKSLKLTYATEGPEGLEKAIAKDQKPGSSAELLYTKLKMIRDHMGIGAVAQTIDQFLATAERRKAALRPHVLTVTFP